MSENEETPFVMDDTTMPHFAVLREFEEPVAWVARHRMAEEIVRLREELNTIKEKYEQFVSRTVALVDEINELREELVQVKFERDGWQDDTGYFSEQAEILSNKLKAARFMAAGWKQLAHKLKMVDDAAVNYIAADEGPMAEIAYGILTAAVKNLHIMKQE